MRDPPFRHVGRSALALPVANLRQLARADLAEPQPYRPSIKNVGRRQAVTLLERVRPKLETQS